MRLKAKGERLKVKGQRLKAQRHRGTEAFMPFRVQRIEA